MDNDYRNSDEAYCLKSTRDLWGVSQLPCPDCPFKEEYPPVSILKQDEKCFAKCPFPIMLWILSKRQWEIYERLRPADKKREDEELAKKEGKLPLIKAISGGLSPLFILLK